MFSSTRCQYLYLKMKEFAKELNFYNEDCSWVPYGDAFTADPFQAADVAFKWHENFRKDYTIECWSLNSFNPWIPHSNPPPNSKILTFDQVSKNERLAEANKTEKFMQQKYFQEMQNEIDRLNKSDVI